MANRKVTAELEMTGKDATGPMWRSVAARMGQIEKQMGRFNQTATQFNAKIKHIERSTSAMAKVTRGVEASSGMLMTGLKAFGAYAVTAGVKQSITSFAEMERHMTRIGITADASKDEVRGATEEVKRLSMQLGYGSFDPAINALDTLTASGMSMKEALAFLPSVMATAQASGAATEDIANSGLKAASAFKIQAQDMQTAFDHMAYSGKLGQFELKDMALYMPSLASSFATLGYKGQEGLDHLLAIMQVIRAHTGTAESANSNAMDLFGKIYSPETINKFKKLGVDLNKELKKATENGEDLVHAFIRLTKETVHGDLKKLPQLFQNEQARMAVIALIDDLQKVQEQIDALNSKQVKGTVMRDVNTVLDGTQTRLDRLSLSWDNFVNQIGAHASTVVVPVLDAVSTSLSDGDAIMLGMKKLGYSEKERKRFLGAFNDHTADPKEIRKLLYAADPTNERYRADYMADFIPAFADSPQMQKMLGRSPTSFVELPPIDHGYTPEHLPKEGPYPFPGVMPRDQYLRDLYRGTGGRMSGSENDFAAILSTPNFPAGSGPMQPPGTQADGSFNAFSGFEEILNSSTERAGTTFGAKATENLESDAERAGSAFGRAAATMFQSMISSLRIPFGPPKPDTTVNADVGKAGGAATPPAKFRGVGGGGW